MINSNLFEEIPADTKHTQLDVFFNGEYFGYCPMTALKLPQKKYYAVFFVVDFLFNQCMDETSKDMLIESWLGWLIKLMSGEVGGDATEDWIKQSEMMSHFTVKESFGFSGLGSEIIT